MGVIHRDRQSFLEGETNPYLRVTFVNQQRALHACFHVIMSIFL